MSKPKIPKMLAEAPTAKLFGCLKQLIKYPDISLNIKTMANSLVPINFSIIKQVCISANIFPIKWSIFACKIIGSKIL